VKKGVRFDSKLFRDVNDTLNFMRWPNV